MRDRLLKMCKKSQAEWLEKTYEHKTTQKLEEYVADYLLASGVIVPPCKVGEKVWLINNPREYEVLNFYFTGQKLWATLILIEEPTIMREINTDYFGKTVFLTKEEAEQALKGGPEE